MRVTRIHQLELTSRCNLRCRYCVHPKMPRPKVDMTWDIFHKALAKVVRCIGHGQCELNLAGIGESTMHPDFAEMVGLARTACGPTVMLAIATNGVSLTRDMVKAIAPYRPSVWVSMHRPEKAGPAIELLKEYGILNGVSADPSIAAMNWAGKTNWHVSCNTSTPCPWLSEGRVMVMADGRVTTCCLDGEGTGVIGHVSDDMSEWDLQPYDLCADCHHTVPVGMKVAV